MSLPRTIRERVARLLGFVRRDAMDQRLDAEMQFHVDMLIDRFRGAGLSAAEARRRALAEFGGAERFKDDARDEYRSSLVEATVQDVRYALRVLRRQPGFATAAILTFALGIGAAGAILSVVHGVLLQPLPYADPGRLVVVWERNAARGNDRNVVSVPTFEAWRDRSRSFMGMAGLVPFPVTLTGTDRAERVMGAEVSSGYFELLGVRPALGRTFTREEERDGGASVVVLSDGFWRSQFGGDPAVVGRSMRLDGRGYTIIGVMPESFDPPRFAWLQEQAFWHPFGATESNRGWGRFLLVVARLKPGTSLAAARADVEAVSAQRVTEDPSLAGWSSTIVSLSEQIVGDARLPLLVLLGAVSLLLLMAFTNVANLTIGLVRRRAHELAIRRAIGASARRVIRQVVTASAVVGAIGCAAGLAVAFLGVRALIALLPPGTPRIGEIRLDATVLLAVIVVATVASLAIGWIAAIGAGHDDVTTLREGGGGRTALRLRGGSLVTAEVALGLMLTVLAGLTIRTFVALRQVDLGFDAQHVAVARIGLSGPRYRSAVSRQQFFDAVLARARAIPGVDEASAMSTRPFGGMAPATTLGDATASATGDSIQADVRYVDARIFQGLGVPLVAGSSFDARDAVGAPPRVVVNESLARKLWPGGNPIGKHLRVMMFNGIVPEVIGVVGDVHLMDARTPPRGTIYLSVTAFPSEVLDIVMRTRGDVGRLGPALRRIVAETDASIPVFQVATMGDVVGQSLARDRFTAALLAAFAAVSLLLAAVGIYGVFAGDVAQRRKEIGIRVALGAPTVGLLALVMRRAVSRALMGIALGSAGAVAAARAMRALLYGVGVTDPVAFGGVAVLLLLVAVAATLVPALRAARVSPLVAIRMD